MKYSVALSLIDRLGSKTQRMLIEELGSARAVMEARVEDLINAGTSLRMSQQIKAQTQGRALSIIEHCEQQGIRILAYGTPEFPQALEGCPDAPIVLYVRGKVDFNSGKWISVVGTRNASQAGLSACDRVVRDLAGPYPDLVVVSGLAFGIDKEAHAAALKYRVKTVAVMAGWVDDIVPRSHYYLARQILEAGGAIVSERPPGSVIEKGNFLQRNRVIAGLSQATIVVESAIRGGSLITAEIASGYNKELFALPGNLQESSMEGTNMLIRSNKAVMYQSTEDVAHALGWQRVVREADIERQAENLPEKLKQAYDILQQDQKYDVEALGDLWGVPLWDAASTINQLRAKGLLRADPYRCYYKG